MAYCQSSSRSCWSRLPHSSTANRRRSLRVVGGSSRPKTALFNVSQACSIVFMSGEYAGHSSLAILLSWRNSFTRCAWWGRELSSIKTNSSEILPIWLHYGSEDVLHVSYSHWAPSMTTSGVRRPHIMPHQNIKGTTTLLHLLDSVSKDVQPDQTASKHVSDGSPVEGMCDTRLWIELDANSKESIQHVFGPICTALHGVLVLNVDLAMDVGSEVAHHAAYFVQFESKHDVLWLHEKHYSAWWRCFQSSSELKSVSSGHQLP